MYVTDKLLKYNSRKFNIKKAVEELAELQTVLMQYLNKSKECKPDNKAITDEIGDVILRLEPLVHIFGEIEVQNRVSNKGAKLEQWMEAKTYKNV
jgi:hypothetical protein